jgi:hypothetical protein
MLAHRPIGCLLFELFLSLCYRPVSTTLFPTPPHALLDDIEHMRMLVPFLSSGSSHSHILAPSRFFLRLLPKKLKDNRIEDVGGAEWRRCSVACLSSMPSTSDGRWSKREDGLPRKSREVEATNGLCASMHVCLGQCGGIRCPNDPKDHPMSHLNIIWCFAGYNIMFYSWGGHEVNP